MTDREGRQRMRFNWGTGLALIYGLFAAGTTGVVVFALRHPVQLVREDYYATSLRQDARREATEQAGGLGVEVIGSRADGRALTIALPAAQARDASGSLRLYRPSDAAADRVVALAVDVDGRQHVPLDGLIAGRWIAQLEWTSGGRAFYRETPVTVR